MIVLVGTWNFTIVDRRCSKTIVTQVHRNTACSAGLQPLVGLAGCSVSLLPGFTSSFPSQFSPANSRQPNRLTVAMRYEIRRGKT